jgi:hypothetical protein
MDDARTEDQQKGWGSPGSGNKAGATKMAREREALLQIAIQERWTDEISGFNIREFLIC